MPLSHAKIGQKVRLKSINWGKGLNRKLQLLGMTPGVSFDVIKGSKFGPWIIEVRGARLALGRGVIDRIEVEPA